MLLANKVAVIYGAGGPIGGAVARAFAREGARVFLAGRIQAKLDKVAAEIRWDGGVADAAVVDALDERAVDEYVNMVVEQAGYLDISFNLIGYGDIQKPLIELSIEDFMQPITNAMRSHFLTARIRVNTPGGWFIPARVNVRWFGGDVCLDAAYVRVGSVD